MLILYDSVSQMVFDKSSKFSCNSIILQLLTIKQCFNLMFTLIHTVVKCHKRYVEFDVKSLCTTLWQKLRAIGSFFFRHWMTFV